RSLSINVRNSNLGKLTRSYLYHSKALQSGAVLPVLTLLSKEGKNIRLKPREGNKLTLIDFWYSHCSPCIGQFPDLKQFYAKYHPKGFEIISISTDKKNELHLWHSTVDKYQLPWPQYIDINAVACPELGINVFPSNFIVDDKGKIISKDVTMVQLQNFLEEYFQDK
ncbi:MAG: TlpA family protein disulfide reductase, partial [Chitinophagaceae bacterium]